MITANLKPLSEITDEDNITFGELLNYNKEYRTTFSEHIMGIDYLRSKGYALPYKDLSVQDLIECKWIKVLT